MHRGGPPPSEGIHADSEGFAQFGGLQERTADTGHVGHHPPTERRDGPPVSAERLPLDSLEHDAILEPPTVLGFPGSHLLELLERDASILPDGMDHLQYVC